MRAMILAAGLGTRLRPITNILPKPLVPIVGAPNIVRTIQHLKEAGITEIVINLYHLGETLEETLGDGSKHGVAIAYSREEELLGTGGGIRKALELLGDSAFVVVNGDALFAPDIEQIVRAHKSRKALATMVVREDHETETYGAVGLDSTNRIRYLVGAGEKERGLRSFMFTGVHVIEPEIGKRLPKNGCIVRHTYMPLLEEGAPLFGMPMAGYFCDLGTLERYLEANVALVTGRVRLKGFDPSPEGIYIGRNVNLAKSCRLGRGAVICDEASVAPHVSVKRSVVFPGAVVEEDIESSVVMPDGGVLQTK